MNKDITKLNLHELRDEYERSQWALAWALRYLGGSLRIPHYQVVDMPNRHRIWYATDMEHTIIKLEEHAAESEQPTKLSGAG